MFAPIVYVVRISDFQSEEPSSNLGGGTFLKSTFLLQSISFDIIVLSLINRGKMLRKPKFGETMNQASIDYYSQYWKGSTITNTKRLQVGPNDFEDSIYIELDRSSLQKRCGNVGIQIGDAFDYIIEDEIGNWQDEDEVCNVFIEELYMDFDPIGAIISNITFDCWHRKVEVVIHTDKGNIGMVWNCDFVYLVACDRYGYL